MPLLWSLARIAVWVAWWLGLLAVIGIVGLLLAGGDTNCSLPNSIYGDWDMTWWPPLGARCTYSEAQHGVDLVDGPTWFFAIYLAGLAIVALWLRQIPWPSEGVPGPLDT